jgi:hypothetical protein
MMKKMCVVLTMAVLLGSPASAALVDDFESYQTGLVRDGVTGGVWTAIGNTMFVSVKSTDENQYLAYGWDGGGPRGGYRAIDPVSSTSTVTLFMQIYAGAGTLDHAFGLTDLAAPGQNYGDFRVQMGAASQSGAADKFRLIGRASAGAQDLALLDRQVWYNVWTVIDHAANTYDVYYTAGLADATAADKVGSAITYRVGTTSSLSTLLTLANWAGEGDSFRIDNIYLSSGVDLSNPVPEPATLVLLGLGGLVAARRRR